jgi:diguanylate cyclase (GGDEF)-like protein
MKKLIGTALLSLIKRSTTLSELYGEEHRHSLQMAHDKLVKGNLELEEKNAETIQELMKKNAELELLSCTDPHTQIANRRHFDTYLLKEWDRAQRSHDHISLILCDLDHFHAYNEAYGYETGNECIRSVARVIEHFTRRPYDISARYGSKKFASLLPHTDTAGAMIIAEGIKAEIEKTAIPHLKSTIKDIVTLSFGVATVIPEKGKDCAKLISMTEEALAESKKEGGDRISIKMAEGV